ncbi:MAG: ribonucleotide-diphosphate reductase subunit beta [Thermoleophilaceae bacterium]|nr:ribonucleotide-diphosphate reductase subunit beta [Thermoleophilaceae bacterium]
MATKIGYGDLYERWEKGNWSATALDFDQDKTDWNEVFTPFERKAALWNYSLFFHGEDSVADNLSPYIDAAPHEEQKYFLTTQQVDEARHAVFFARFMREVVGIGGESISSSLEATRPDLTWGFKKVFERLDTMADELRKDRSRPKLAAAITLYHFVVEATLAQPGQHFIESYLKDRGMLPGFTEGMTNVSLDEQRHIGFGVRCLYDLNREDPDCAYAVADLLREIVTVSVGVFVPPNWDERYVTTFGKTLEDVYEEGMNSLESKMRAAGLPIEELPGAPVFPRGLSVKERTANALTLLRANYLGEKFGPPSRDPETVALMFDVISRSMADDGDRPTTLQWEFADAEPWFVRVDNGSTYAHQGRAESPDMTLACRFEDWVDIAAGREDPRRAMLRGKLRPKGNPLRMWRARSVLG